MTIQDIVQYVLHTPYNTNPKILTEMLRRFETEIRKEYDPETPGIDIIYDGGQVK